MATAQRVGTRIGRDAQIGDANDARQAVEIIGDCIAARRPNLADRWLRLLPGSPEESALLDEEEEDLGLCMDNDELILGNRELRYQPPSLRRATSISLARRRASGAPDASPAAADSEPWFMPMIRTLPQNSPVNTATLALQDFGHCVALREWAGTRAMLRSEPGSSEEAEAVRTLSPHLGACLSEGMTVRITTSVLRTALAEPFLHILASAER